MFDGIITIIIIIIKTRGENSADNNKLVNDYLYTRVYIHISILVKTRGQKLAQFKRATFGGMGYNNISMYAPMFAYKLCIHGENSPICLPISKI